MAYLSGLDLCAIPMAMPPEGRVSNFVDPPSLSRVIIAVNATVMVSAVLTTAGRLFVNRKMLTRSDYFALAALVFTLCEASMMLLQLRLARHMWDIPVCWILGDMMKIQLARAWFVVTGTALAKIAILSLFHQLFKVEWRVKIAVRVGIVASGIIWLVSIILESYYLAPSAGQTWDESALSGKSTHSPIWAVSAGVVTLVLDLYIFLLPIPCIAKLKWSTRRRLKALAVFSTGILAVVATLASLVYRIRMMQQASDITWNAALVLLCLVVEAHIAIIVSSMPGFAKFMRVYVTSKTAGSGSASSIGDEKNRPRTAWAGREQYVEMRDSWLFRTNATAEHGVDAALGMQPAAENAAIEEVAGRAQSVLLR